MKKLLCLMLAMLMLALVSCEISRIDKSETTTSGSEETKEVKEEKSRKEGYGASTWYSSVMNTDGTYSDVLIVSAAAVLLDEEGRIAKCDIDSKTIYDSSVTSVATCVVPRTISKYRFENEILGKLDKNDIGESWAYKKLSASYYLYDPNDDTKADAVINAMHERYPVTKSGMAIYAFTDITSREIKELDGYIKEYIPEYTFAEMLSDHAETMWTHNMASLGFHDESIDLENTEIAAFEEYCIGKTAMEIMCSSNSLAIPVADAISKAVKTDKNTDDTIEASIDASCLIYPNLAEGKYDVDLHISTSDKLLISGTPFTDEELQISPITE
ncbi:MAG: hypothetical protein IJC81_00410 [Clostridia bacterium]|nr:hypothetical protein [Clostridia bacterium]